MLHGSLPFYVEIIPFFVHWDGFQATGRLGKLTWTGLPNGILKNKKAKRANVCDEHIYTSRKRGIVLFGKKADGRCGQEGLS